jgi:hypothetical protein
MPALPACAARFGGHFSLTPRLPGVKGAQKKFLTHFHNFATFQK